MEGDTKGRDPSFISVSTALISAFFFVVHTHTHIYIYIPIEPVDLFRGI